MRCHSDRRRLRRAGLIAGGTASNGGATYLLGHLLASRAGPELTAETLAILERSGADITSVINVHADGHRSSGQPA